MSPTLPASLIAKLSPRCARCPSDRAPDSAYCTECEADQRGYERKSKAQLRDTRRAAHECIDCGDRLAKEYAGSRCLGCRVDRAKAAARRRGGKHKARGVKRPGSDLPLRMGATSGTPPVKRGHFKVEVFSDGAERTRYVGQSHRGGPTRVEQDSSAAKHALGVLARLTTWLDERVETQAQIDELPRIQRAEGRKMLWAQLTYLGRQLIQAGADGGDDGAKAMLRLLDPDAEEA